MKRMNTKAIYSGIFLVFVFLGMIAEVSGKKLYSYQSGNWNGTNVWTTDSTGTTLVGSAIPASTDIVCVLTGRTILATANIYTSGHVIYITVGSTLDLAGYTLTSIVLNGMGLLRTSRSETSAVLPTITGGDFLSIDGGTVEYYAPTGNIELGSSSTPTYCNLIVNLGSSSQVLTVTRNMSVFGSLTINSGTFQINDATTSKRSLVVNHDFTVGLNGRVTVGTGNTNTSGYKIQPTTNLPPGGQFHLIFHELSIGGDFTNNGSVRFTNLTVPNYGEFANNGAVTVRFNGERHATLTLNGITDFYNLIVDKGIDQTYILTVNSADIANFALYGPNAVRRNEASPFNQDNPEVRKALWIRNGTLRLTGNIMIPTLAEGPIGPSGNGDYAIGSAAQLWIDGPNVSVYVTASNNSGFPEAPVGSVGVTTIPAAEQALSIFGTFRISDGYFSTRHSAGIIFWNTANSSSVVMVEGGTLNTTVMRSTWTAPGKTSYVQTGGTVIVRGNETEPGEMSGVPIFNIPNPSSTFVMTGGDIIIRDRNNGTATEGTGLYLNCDQGNYSVTGGNITFEVNPAHTPSVDIYSRVNMWNLNIKRLGSSGNAVVNMKYDITVANSLTIFSGATLSSGTGNYNIHSYGDVYINPGGTYTPGANTTSYKGYGNKFLWNDGTITNGLYNLEADKIEGSLILVSTAGSFTVRNDLRILSGTLADGGKTVFVNGNVINNGIHVGAGKISMNRSSGFQTISGNGSGLFQNLELNNTYGSTGTSPISLSADITVIGQLTLANDRLFNINKYQLTLKTLATVEGTMGNNRFILTSGNPSDGGVRREYSDTTSFIFPVGNGNNYTPATIHIRKIPQTYGSVSVRPVPGRHPFTTNSTCLPYYWKVEESGFSGIKATSVRLLFNYGNLTDNPAYVPGKYNPAAWVFLNDVSLVNESTNMITFPAEDSFTGDYTAGIPDAFGVVSSFYSRGSGDWSVPATWSNESHGGIPAITIPGNSNPVFIGDGGSYNHTVTVTAGNAVSGSLSIIQGSVLDIGATSGNNFGTVVPGSSGTLRITSNTATALFPAGDFGNFLGAGGGLVEYYSNGLSFFIPVVSSAPTSLNLTTYHDLSLVPSTGYTITMPNLDLQVYGDMMVNGTSGTAMARLNAASSRTLTIINSLRVVAGILQYQNNVAQALRIDGDVSIAGGATFAVAGSGAAAGNTLSIGGDVSNDGILDLSVSSSLKCEVTFTGNTDTFIRGRGATTDFYLIRVDKGTTSIPVLNVISSAFSFSNNTAPLILVNGTFRLTSALTVVVSQLQFDIPPTTCLSANGGTLQVATAANDDADIILAGMIEVKAGEMYIGNSANNNNNDIEYSGAGFPAIEVRGGTLFVNGQIRRSMINGLGSLVYRQSGASSVVIVNGRNGQPTRAKLEVVNSGSVFNMSGGTINIVRGGSTTYNDFYIRPESSIVTGGTVIFGDAGTEATYVSNLTLDSTFPLNNITVDGTNNPKTLKLAVNPLILKGSLVIDATSSFRADSLNVSIAGNLTNLNTNAGTGVNSGGYQPGSFRQVTTFNGNIENQTITGVAGNITNFAMLVVNNTYPNGMVTLQAGSATRVNSNLTLTRGILADGGNIITVIGDIDNWATHQSSGSGRILLAGPAVQVITGNGSGKFGNIYMNSTYDVRMTSTTEITGVLTFQGKLLDIGHKLLILSNTSASSVVGTFSATCCIRTDGLVSDEGVMKYYPASARDFTFPVGVPGKYTPARMNVTMNSAAGTITMIPVNGRHPCYTGSGTSLLRFYWHVVASGFNGFTITQYYTYVQGDVGGTESTYVGDRYYNGVWDNPTSGTVNTSSNIITFANKPFIDGDYTAGASYSFGVVPTYYSRDATCTSPLIGNWNSTTTWSTVSHSGAAASTYPTGEPVVIADNHIVRTNGSSRSTSVLTLNGTGILDLANTVGHNLGTVLGTGTISLTPTTASLFVFPAGNYSIFTAAGGGTIELQSTSGVAVFPYLNTYNNLILKGAGSKQMIDADITLNGILTNETASTFIASSIGSLILKSDWVNDGFFNHNSGTTVFDGNTTLLGSSPPVLNNVVINTDKILTGPLAGIFGMEGNWLNNGDFYHNGSTVNFSGNTTIEGLSTTTFNHLTVQSEKILTGKLGDGFVVLGNWLNNGLFNHNGGTVIFDGVSLITGVSRTNFGNITINDSKFLTGPAADTMKVAIDFVNYGNFIHNDGTLEFNGNIQVLDGTAATLFTNIKVASGSNTTINAYGQTIRGVLFSDGVLNANENLTLLSDAGQTALIDGTGSGDVVGYLTIQRYLPSGFGYKYFSTPFQAAEVGQFGDHMNLYASFPTFYKYDENRMFTGWLNYTDPSGLLVPMEGYAVNFGPTAGPVTVDIIGQVNNSTMLPLTLFNRNHTYTLGFNLIGNPYPSPIDWDATSGWVRENMDDALYYFNAGTTDQYTGTYSTYINKISSDGIASNIIPAMQGFFMHVSDGAYPVAATLIFTNGVRVNNLSPHFHKEAVEETRSLMRITARYEKPGCAADAMVVYFDSRATNTFDPDCDALKLMNTDILAPNLFSVSSDSQNLSINGLPEPVDSITMVALGVKTMTDGFLVFNLCDIERMHEGQFVYFCDKLTGAKQNLILHPFYRSYLQPGEYLNRFYLIFSKYDLRYQPSKEKIFHAYSSRNRLFVYMNLPEAEQAELSIYNMTGQKILTKNMAGNGYREMEVAVPTGIYIISLKSAAEVYTKKVFFNTQ